MTPPRSCAFAAFGGIFFGYDSGYINGVLGSQVFIDAIEGAGSKAISSSHTSLIVSILSAGTFFGALLAGDIADRVGRRPTIIAGCVIYAAGVVVQMFAASALATIVVGRLIAGFGVGFVSAIIILYMVRSVPGALFPLVSADFFPPPPESPFSVSSFPVPVRHDSSPRLRPHTQSEICPKKVRGALVSGYREFPESEPEKLEQR